MDSQLIKIAIVEDSPEDLSNCVALLEKYSSEKGLNFDIETFNSGDSFSMHYKSQYDFIILDINLSLSNGIDIARDIRLKDEEVIIMFATNLAKYATHGYEVDAIDFALKPLSYASFYLKLEKVMKRLSSRDNSFIMVVCKDGMYKLDISSILYIEVISHDIIFHLTNGTEMVTSGTLKKYEEELKSHWFLRCNSCYLVNARKIRRVDKLDIELVNGKMISISHPKRKAFVEAFKNYVMKGGK
ncbi:MAG: LytTR family DNA-binding domain-containing protein [Bacilli bacterium]|nr:LytTR family DNA-binding domain-containing protein [Bacilli bacterium]